MPSRRDGPGQQKQQQPPQQAAMMPHAMMMPQALAAQVMMQQAMMQPVQQQEQQQQPEDVGYSSGEEARIKEDRKVISRAYKHLGGRLGVARSWRIEFIEDSQLRIQKGDTRTLRWNPKSYTLLFAFAVLSLHRSPAWHLDRSAWGGDQNGEMEPAFFICGVESPPVSRLAS